MRPHLLFLAGLLSTGMVNEGAAAPPAGMAVRSAEIVRVTGAHSLSDGEIAYLYMQANLFDVETAELARAKGTAPEVKQHGEEVAKDHRGVVKMFEELLHRNGIKPVAPADSAIRSTDQQKILADLKQKTGAEFDRAYIVEAVANHRAVIKTVRETFLPAVRDGQLATHFKDMLPAFEHHLAMTLDAAKALGVPTD